ncbi:nucleoside-diphosphate kinase [bacterium]|nr:nucleoside-diphosphate kinase [bacterium]
MAQRTYAMIKPHAVKAKNVGKIIDMIEQNGFTLVRMEKMKLSREKAEQFYGAHKEKPFFEELVSNIIDGPVIALALEKENAIADWRKLMGATDSKKAESGTIRQQFGIDISFNAVHGSDAPETAEQELNLIFSDL